MYITMQAVGAYLENSFWLKINLFVCKAIWLEVFYILIIM